MTKAPATLAQLDAILAKAKADGIYIELAAAENVAGVILTPSGPNTDIVPLTNLSIPTVLADRRLSQSAVDSVMVDNLTGAAQAVDHLVLGGFKRIACITGPLWTTTGAERHEGYTRALARAGVAIDDSLVRVADFRQAGGKTAMKELLMQAGPPDAVFVTNHLMMIGALQAIAEAQLDIPRDIGIVSFDDVSWSSLLRPPLSAVAQPAYDLGVEAGRLLLSRVEGYTGSARLVVLAPLLHIRGSSVLAPGPSGWRTEGQPHQVPAQDLLDEARRIPLMRN
jgi:LacI family transcriptional regulator